jgi:hypothetical protein
MTSPIDPTGARDTSTVPAAAPRTSFGAGGTANCRLAGSKAAPEFLRIGGAS